MVFKERINMIEVPEALPIRGNRLTRFLGRAQMAMMGWRFAGELPDLPKMVLILAPHTSNMDFIVGLAPLFALGLRLSFMAKSQLFWEPFGTYLRWLGSVPIDRSAPGGVVRQAVRQFEGNDKFLLVITPEGTRTKVKQWKTGFYVIAKHAEVPILPLVFDYGQREVRFEELLVPSGDLEKDLKILKSYYHPSQARNPNSF
ncbi:MAG: lysophospholipid acyltransferase family protein [Candidatus Promineifilaceae bacterium]|nr:lysophospholipid acyltransferase family protein [Candidatus Promineifilaceae bacterium]